MNFWMWVRSCARCSRYLPPIDLLCESCWQDMANHRQPRRRWIFDRSFEVFSLWDWRGDHDDIGELIKKRKSPCFDEAHFRLARWVLREKMAPFRGVKSVVFPSKDPRERDHTASLAEAFAEILQIPAVPVQILTDGAYKTQGQKSRLAGRRARRLRERDVLYPTVFIDDVLTSGATALAVWKALGKPREFSALVLTYKTRRYGAR